MRRENEGGEGTTAQQHTTKKGEKGRRKENKGYGPSTIDFTEFSLHVGEFEANVFDVFFGKRFGGSHEDVACVCDSEEFSRSADVE